MVNYITRFGKVEEDVYCIEVLVQGFLDTLYKRATRRLCRFEFHEPMCFGG